MNNGIVVLLSNNESAMNYKSNTYRYRQDSTFIYFYGLSLPGLTAVMDLETGTDMLFGDDYTIDDIIWMGEQPSVAELAARCGVEKVCPTADLQQFIQKAQNAGKTIHFLPPYRDDNRLFLSHLTGISVSEINAKASVELIKSIVNLRSIKSAEEVQEMDKICNTGVKMHTAVMQLCHIGTTERRLAGSAEGIALSEGNGVSFPVILSQNGQTLHNHDHSQILQDGRLLLADMGAEAISCYNSDYTRTFPVSGKFTQKQKEIYEIVLKANMETIEKAKPGIPYFDVHLHAVTVLAEGLTALGLMKGEPQQAAKVGAVALFMPHGLGHHIGLDVHDMEDYGEDYVGYDQTIHRSTIFGHASLRCGKVLQPGFIVSDEPGIYFIPQLIDIWEKEKKFAEFINYEKVRQYLDFGGIRIEDDLLITGTGCRVLGEPLPKTVNEIEAIVGTK